MGNRMKIRIGYQFMADREPSFWATSMLDNGMVIWSCGNSWEQARERHIERLKRYSQPMYPPPTEEIEI